MSRTFFVGARTAPLRAAALACALLLVAAAPEPAPAETRSPDGLATAGLTDPGTNAYPDAGLRVIREYEFYADPLHPLQFAAVSADGTTLLIQCLDQPSFDDPPRRNPIWSRWARFDARTMEVLAFGPVFDCGIDNKAWALDPSANVLFESVHGQVDLPNIRKLDLDSLEFTDSTGSDLGQVYGFVHRSTEPKLVGTGSGGGVGECVFAVNSETMDVVDAYPLELGLWYHQTGRLLFRESANRLLRATTEEGTFTITEFAMDPIAPVATIPLDVPPPSPDAWVGAPPPLAGLVLDGGARSVWLTLVSLVMVDHEAGAQTASIDLGDRKNYWNGGTAYDPLRRRGFFYPNLDDELRVLAVDLDTFTALGSKNLGATLEGWGMLALSPDGSLLYTVGNRDNLQTVATSQKGLLKATRVDVPEYANLQSMSWYSHRAEGNVRLALYGGEEGQTLQLLWRSQEIRNGAEEGAIDVEIGSGAPRELVLSPGTYWLAWQVDTTWEVPSLTTGEAGDGFYVVRAFDEFPASIAAADRVATDETWTQSIAYRALAAPAGFVGAAAR